MDDGLDLGEACNVGVGACNRRGVNVCAVNGGVTCGAVPGAPQAEACDGVDNNCDGAVDEGNPGGGGQDCDTGLPGVCAGAPASASAAGSPASRRPARGRGLRRPWTTTATARTDEDANGGAR